jgi:helix-turn-helix protein
LFSECGKTADERLILNLDRTLFFGNLRSELRLKVDMNTSNDLFGKNPDSFDIHAFAKQFSQLVIEEVRSFFEDSHTKDWYTTDELATALNKSPFTIREKWCNAGRIECEKDSGTGKWRIPGAEYRRLVNGGALKPTPT